MHPPTPLRIPPDMIPNTGLKLRAIQITECAFNQSGTGHKYKDKFVQSSPVFSHILSSAFVLFPIVSVCCTCGRYGSCDVSECGSDYRRTVIRQLTLLYIQPHIMTLSPTLPFETFLPSSDFFSILSHSTRLLAQLLPSM